MNKVTSNPYSAPELLEPPPTESPLLQRGMAGWISRLVLVSVGIGLLQTIWMHFVQLRIIHVSEFQVIHLIGSLIIGAIGGSTPAWGTGLLFRGSQVPAEHKRIVTPRNFVIGVFVLQVLLILLREWTYHLFDFASFYDRWGSLGVAAYAIPTSILVNVPGQVMMMAFVANSWDTPVRWSRLIKLAACAWLMWEASQYLIARPVYESLGVTAPDFQILFTFMDRACWSLCFGVMLPFVAKQEPLVESTR